ncbi:MAG: hypothetical protein IPJ20_15260 [Flammeovirgaceae bacterium]|nr:hypothetical protein [Flammeovirgaceae bacterium]
MITLAMLILPMTSSSNVTIARAVGTGSTANAPYQLVTFPDTNPSPTPATYYSLASGAWESNTSWSFSANGSSGAVAVGLFPRRLDNVVIRTGHTITIDNVTDNGLCGVSPDGLGRSNVGPLPRQSYHVLSSRRYFDQWHPHCNGCRDDDQKVIRK